MQLPVLQAAVAAMSPRVDVLALAGRMDAAAAAHEAALIIVSTILGAESESPRAWERLALLLCDTRAPCVVDALSREPGDALRLRAAALLDLPAVQSIESLGDMHDVIAAAIDVGAPRYNRGDVRDCAVKYWVTAQTLLATPASRGFPGHARALGLLRTASELDPLPVALDERGVDDLAWRIRRAFDAVLALRA